MSLVLAAFGFMGVTFGRLGAQQKKAASGGGGGGTNSLDFSDANNSQYICVISGA